MNRPVLLLFRQRQIPPQQKKRASVGSLESICHFVSRLGGGSTRVRSCANQEAWPAWLVSRSLSYLFDGSTRLAPAGYKHGAPNSSDACGVAIALAYATYTFIDIDQGATSWRSCARSHIALHDSCSQFMQWNALVRIARALFGKRER